MTVMDDYDGGRGSTNYDKVIDDLKELDGTKFSKSWYFPPRNAPKKK